jgi:hypothetical protein
MAADLLAYFKSHSEPRLFKSFPTSPEKLTADEAAALAAQAELVAYLETRTA